jgi:deazaflavin-dependent oxidoreductase (nitroreductase family)
MRAFAASRAGTRVFKHTLHHLDRLLDRTPGVHRTAVEILAGLPVGMLTTTGARSGLPRTVPLLAFPMEGGWGVVASSWGSREPPGWYFNLVALPQARFGVDGIQHDVVAQRLHGEQREQLRRTALTYYAGYAEYEKRAGGRDLGFFLLTPVPA